MASAGDRASAPGTKGGKGSKPKTRSVRSLLEPPPVQAATTSPTAGSGSRREASQSVASSGTCESPATVASVAASVEIDATEQVQVPINVDNDEQEDDEQARLSGKRFKKLTSWVWSYFTKKKEYGNL
ncbi:Emsy N Terminus (ENT)/ plant Tudor-likedomains-containing protein [Striga asiatica]|uniref:Emsy N Terminus (ENT)/ plant Tudor-likedomains-containing protein n=1 Tax=Striga asiatica TaxID=4170 RepID=A0A5A7Q759_STRAF|nr:Emsy N Terminus (ENT)/ plant Tudor-likedomains-containing protein [Striga asiatica]